MAIANFPLTIAAAATMMAVQILHGVPIRKYMYRMNSGRGTDLIVVISIFWHFWMAHKVAPQRHAPHVDEVIFC